jgi:zinc transport system substrate-binding protein
MRNDLRNVIILISVLLIGALLIYNYVNIPEKENKENLNIVVSILPQKAFVNAIGGDFVNVTELIPPGASPATYEPKPSDLALVENADIYFKVGYIPFEKSHSDKLAELNPEMDVVDTSINVQLRYFGGDEERGIDPHIWLSTTQVKKQVDVITEALSEADPEHADLYQSNAETFKEQLDELHDEIKSELEETRTDKLMVFHPAWGYFAEEYGLEQIAIEQSGKEPTAEQLQNLIDMALEENIKVIFVQSQFDTNIAESIAEEIGAIVVTINPLSEDYINNLRNVATTIAENLNK